MNEHIRSRGVSWRLFLTCWLIFALHFATNTVREIYPALSLADHFSFDVSEYADFHPDIFRVAGGGAFINNNPGASIVGAVPYFLCKPIVDRMVAAVQARRAANPASQPQAYDSPWPMAREFMQKARARGLDVKFGLAAGIMQALAMAPLSALAVVLMFRWLEIRTDSPRAALWLAVLYAAATPVLYRTAQLNQNVLIAHAAFAAFVLLAQSYQPQAPARANHAQGFFVPGLLAGLCVLLDYSGLVVLAALGLFAVVQRRTAADVIRFSLGASIGLAALAAYQWVCFGNPLYPAQHYMPPAHFTERGYQGFDWPQADLLWDTTFGPRFGLFTSAPLLVLALWIPAWRPREATSARQASRLNTDLLTRRELGFVLCLSVAFLLFCAANQYGRMQFNCGVRHAVPITPFVFVLAAGTLLRLPRIAAVPIALACFYWAWCLAMYRDVERGDGIIECFKAITFGGPRLPWIETAWRMGSPLGGGVSAIMASTLVLLVAAACIALLWRNCRIEPGHSAA